MTTAEYAEFVPHQIAEFAEQMIRAGEWTRERALDEATARSENLLDGTALETGHRFFVARMPERKTVGWIWEGPSPIPNAKRDDRWLYQITIDEAHRGRGYGNAVLEMLEEKLARENARELRLNVFLWNDIAIRLYEKRGYELVAAFETARHYAKTFA